MGGNVELPADKVRKPFEAGWDVPDGNKEAGEETEELVTNVSQNF